ncbi:hypothetical protein ACFL9U_05450 [Thermodesulfobacteriota bacterium]
MDDRYESKWKSEIEEIEARVKTIVAKVEKLYPDKNKELPIDEGQQSTADGA